MKKLVFLFVSVLVFMSCATNRVYVRNHSERMRLVMTEFPEIYRLYCNGDVVIDQVVIINHNGERNVRVLYRYR